MVGAILKGALISFSAVGASMDMTSSPNVIVFQFNPETISHDWTEATTGASGTDPLMNFSPLATSGVPSERFSFTLILDSDEQLADAGLDLISASEAKLNGIYAQLSALEMLQFPVTSAVSVLVGQVSAAANAAGLGQSAYQYILVPVSEVPVVLFVWGLQRIVPVRVTGLTVKETLYNVLLNPTHAEVEISLTVLTPNELAAVAGPMSKIASMAYSYNQGLRQARAAENLAQSATSVLGMLPISL
jgi:hypothetical protein